MCLSTSEAGPSPLWGGVSLLNADHLPLYRQAQIYSRQGIDLDRSTLSGWVGKAAYELRPVFDALIADLKQSTKLFMDETRAPVLDPGKRKTKTGYFWALARDDRPWTGAAPPGVAFTYAPGRSGQYADDILKGFSGILQVPSRQIAMQSPAG